MKRSFIIFIAIGAAILSMILRFYEATFLFIGIVASTPFVYTMESSLPLNRKAQLVPGMLMIVFVIVPLVLLGNLIALVFRKIYAILFWTGILLGEISIMTIPRASAAIRANNIMKKAQN